MKKSDLKNGMWIEFKNGIKAIVLLNTNNGDILSSAERKWCTLDNYNDNLETYNPDYNIIKIIQPSDSCYYYNINDDVNYNIIWEREDKPTTLNFNITINPNNIKDVENIISVIQKQILNYKLL